VRSRLSSRIWAALFCRVGLWRSTSSMPIGARGRAGGRVGVGSEPPRGTSIHPPRTRR